MKHLLITFLFLTIFLHADDSWSLRFGTGEASKNDFGEIISGQHTKHSADVGVVGVDLGYQLVDDAFDWPLDIYVYGAVYRYLEGEHQDDFYEGVFYFKAFYNFDFLENRIRLGAAEGVSYAQNIPYIEKIEAEENGDNNSYFLNYLDISLDFDLGRLIRYKPIYDSYLGIALKHRSGVFGLYNNVRRGGSNYVMLTFEKKF